MKGKLFLILGSSGSGKGTVLSALRQKHKDWIFPLSCTTRDKRPHEQDGEVYNFISKEEFERKVIAGDFLEYATVHQDNRYGTLKKPIIEALEAGKTVVREVDVQGLYSIRDLIPEDQLISIFLTVKSWDILKARILRRSKISDDEMEKRYESYLRESKWAKECDYVVESVEGDQERIISKTEKLITDN
jgi:guanylate kinase